MSMYIIFTLSFSLIVMLSDPEMIMYSSVNTAGTPDKVPDSNSRLSLLLASEIAKCSDCSLVLLDKKGFIISANDRYFALSGYSESEISSEKITFPDTLLVDEKLRGIITSKIEQGVIYSETLRHVRPDKSVYWTEATLMPLSITGYGQDGIIGVLRDVTGKWEAEQDYLRAKAISEKIVSNIPNTLVTMIKPDNTYLLAEGEGIHMFGFTKQDYLSNHVFGTFSESEQNEVLQLRRRGFNGEFVSANIKIRDHYYIVRYIPLYDADGKIEMLLNISLDITDIKKAELEIKDLNTNLEKKVAERTLQLDQANKELEAFSYSVSHDLRAPLRIIAGYAEILTSDFGSAMDDEPKEMLNRILNNTHRMGKLIDELLNLARIGRKDLNIKDQVDMNKVVANVMADQRIDENKKYTIQVEDLPAVRCDPGLISQVWTNLVSNAIKYSSKVENPNINIGWKETATDFIFFVKDNGAGFDMEYKEKLFGVFQRLHKKSEFEGTGVGLALVKRIINRHGGDIYAEAEVNKGATFYFSLPKINN